MINTANTIYVIQYDYDLNGSSINIPDNCVLKFEGGTLSNGTITFNKTHITDGKFINVIPLGNINNTIAYAKWFESEDDTKVIHWLFTIAANNVQIELENKTYNIDTTNPDGYANGFIKIDNCNSFIVNGNGAKIYDISGSTMAALTFTGAVEATYNGSTPVTVNIPTGGGGGGEDGKTPVMQIGNVTTVAAGGNATADVRADGADPSGNPIYKVDFGIPRGSNEIDGDDGVSAGFGEPTASAEAVASDVAPSVVVTATGTNTSKVFNFAFKIPKGINGTDGDNGLTPTIGEMVTG